MIADMTTALMRVGTAVGCAAVASAVSLAAPISGFGAGPGLAHADSASLPVFVPYPSGWSPNYTVFPYNLWQNRVTPQMVDAERDSCQWFNAQYDALSAESWGFQDALRANFDSWDSVQGAADALKANIDQSAAFLDSRAHTLYITNYPDQSQYSPLFHGDSFFHIWYQLTQLSDKIARQLPSGVINANNATMKVYGDVIRSSGVCNGA